MCTCLFCVLSDLLFNSLFQDLTNLYDQYRSIEPWLQRKEGLEKDGKEHFQSVEDRKKLVGC